MADSIFQLILKNPKLNPNEWARWLASSENESASQTRKFLEECYQNIRMEKRAGVGKKLAFGDRAQVESTIHELVAHELLWRLHLYPKYEPPIRGLNPDLGFTVGQKLFLADVFVMHSPSRTLRTYPNGTGEAKDTSRPSESRAKKIADCVASKAVKYRTTQKPLVLFGFLGDHRILSWKTLNRPCSGEQ